MLDVNFKAGTYVVTIVNPVSLEKTNVTLKILGNSRDNIPGKNIVKHAPIKITKKVSYPVYKIYKNEGIEETSFSN